MPRKIARRPFEEVLFRAVFPAWKATRIDPVKSLRWPIILALAALLIAGFAPGHFFSYLRPSVEALLPK